MCAEISASGIKFSIPNGPACRDEKYWNARAYRKNYVIENFKNFQVTISINVKFDHDRRDEIYHMIARNNSNLEGLETVFQTIFCDKKAVFWMFH